MTIHSYAAAQPTATGKILWPLHAHGGRVYAGYGDYNANTGPCHIMSADPVTLAWTDHHTLQSEAIYQYRTLSDGLYVPSTDPVGASLVDYATNASGTWASRSETVSVTHAFDMAERVPGELWIVGAQGNDAVAWKRVGGVWSLALRVTPAAGFSRFYFAAALGASIHLQAVNSASSVTVSKVWNGTAWADGPNLLGGRLGWNPTPWGSGFLLHSYGHGLAWPLGYFDGVTMTWGSRNCSDYAVNGSDIYALEPDLSIVTHSTDFVSWDTAAVAPSNAAGFAMIGTTGYLGLADSTIQTRSLAHAEPAPAAPDPTAPPVVSDPPGLDPAPSPSGRARPRFYGRPQPWLRTAGDGVRSWPLPPPGPR